MDNRQEDIEKTILVILEHWVGKGGKEYTKVNIKENKIMADRHKFPDRQKMLFKH